VLTCVLGITFFSCQRPDTFEERRQIAKAMLQRKFDVVVDVSTELIKKKHPIVAMGVEIVAKMKCDCITDSLAVQFANGYSLEKLQDLETAPIESLQLTVEKVLDKDDHCVMNCITHF
jgi:hypothetical protein